MVCQFFLAVEFAFYLSHSERSSWHNFIDKPTNPSRMKRDKWVSAVTPTHHLPPLQTDHVDSAAYQGHVLSERFVEEKTTLFSIYRLR